VIVIVNQKHRQHRHTTENGGTGADTGTNTGT